METKLLDFVYNNLTILHKRWCSRNNNLTRAAYDTSGCDGKTPLQFKNKMTIDR